MQLDAVPEPEELHPSTRTIPTAYGPSEEAKKKTTKKNHSN